MAVLLVVGRGIILCNPSRTLLPRGNPAASLVLFLLLIHLLISLRSGSGSGPFELRSCGWFILAPGFRCPSSWSFHRSPWTLHPDRTKWQHQRFLPPPPVADFTFHFGILFGVGIIGRIFVPCVCSSKSGGI